MAAFECDLVAARQPDPSRPRRAAVVIAITLMAPLLSPTVIGAPPAQRVRIARPAKKGAQLWVARYNGPSQGVNYDEAVAVTPNPDGSVVFVTGSSIGAGTRQDYATIAYDAASGDEDWVARYNGPGNSFDFPAAIAASPDGSAVFVTGESTGPNGYYTYATIAYEAGTGHRLWVSRYGQNGGTATALAVSPDGSVVYVTGTVVDAFKDQAYATVAYDASSGRRLWVARYTGRRGYARGVALAVAPDGSAVFVTGQALGFKTALDYVTVAYKASTGTRLWLSRYVGTCTARTCDGSWVADLAVSPDGSAVFVTGYTLSGGWDLATVAYRMSNGREIWASRYHPGGTNNYANALTVSPDGASVFVTGTGPANGYLDYVTVAYDASNGDQRWVERYDGPAGEEDDAVALAMAPDGTSVFVTGYSDGSGTYEDYATIAYDPSTGDQRWVERYDGPARFPDFALAIAVSPDGSVVFVTGRSWSGTNYDYATVAYSSG